jgi:hypothetical protein
MNYYSFNINTDSDISNEIDTSYFISSDFKQFYYSELETWLFVRPSKVFNLYPITLDIVQDACYSGYTYNDPNFEGTYFGTSTTPSKQLLFVYKQFNTDILFQSIYAPTHIFKTPTKSSTLQVQSDLTNLFIGIKLTNTDDINLLLTTS